MLDRDVAADERQILAQYRSRGRGHAQRIVFNQADHRERGQPFSPAGDREPGADGVRYLVCAVREAVRLNELDLTAAVHGHDASESVLISDRADCLRPGQHLLSVPPWRFLPRGPLWPAFTITS